MKKHILFRIISAVILIAAIAGIAAFAFNAGMSRGLALNPQSAAIMEQVRPGMDYGFPYRAHMFPGAFLPGLFFVIFLFFLAAGAGRRMMCGPRYGWGHHLHHHGGGWDENRSDENFVPPMFAEMHRRAHEKTGAEPKPE